MTHSTPEHSSVGQSTGETSETVRERLKKAGALQARLACIHFGTNDANTAMLKWTNNPNSPESPSAKFRTYLESLSAEDQNALLDEKDSLALGKVLGVLGISESVH